MQVDADYWLLSDAGVGITDMWRSDCILSYTLLISFFISMFIFPATLYAYVGPKESVFTLVWNQDLNK